MLRTLSFQYHDIVLIVSKYYFSSFCEYLNLTVAPAMSEDLVNWGEGQSLV